MKNPYLTNVIFSTISNETRLRRWITIVKQLKMFTWVHCPWEPVLPKTAVTLASLTGAAALSMFYKMSVRV